MDMPTESVLLPPEASSPGRRCHPADRRALGRVTGQRMHETWLRRWAAGPSEGGGAARDGAEGRAVAGGPGRAGRGVGHGEAVHCGKEGQRTRGLLPAAGEAVGLQREGSAVGEHGHGGGAVGVDTSVGGQFVRRLERQGKEF